MEDGAACEEGEEVVQGVPSAASGDERLSALKVHSR